MRRPKPSLRGTSGKARRAGRGQCLAREKGKTGRGILPIGTTVSSNLKI